MLKIECSSCLCKIWLSKFVSFIRLVEAYIYIHRVKIQQNLFYDLRKEALFNFILIIRKKFSDEDRF